MSLRGWNLPQVLLSSLTCIQVIQEPSTAITTDKIGKSRMYTISTRVQGRPDSKNALWMEDHPNWTERAISYETRNGSIGVIIECVDSKETWNVYVLVTLFSGLREVSTSQTLIQLPVSRSFSMRKTSEFPPNSGMGRKPKLARNEKISLSRQPQL